jgi:hypothetical protein
MEQFEAQFDSYNISALENVRPVSVRSESAEKRENRGIGREPGGKT